MLFRKNPATGDLHEYPRRHQRAPTVVGVHRIPRQLLGGQQRLVLLR